MLDIYICEDEPSLLNSYVELVKEIITEEELRAQLVLATASPDEILHHANRTDNTCLFFLDIDLGREKNGMNLAQELKSINTSYLVAFITSHLELCREPSRYKIETLDYILKGPKVRDDIRKDIEIGILRSKEAAYRKLYKIRLSEKVSLPPNDIICLESDKKNIIVHGTRSSFPFVGSLSSIEDFLDDRFVRISNSCIINIDHVYNADTRKPEGIEMIDGSHFVVSRSERNNFKKNFLARQMKIEFGDM